MKPKFRSFLPLGITLALFGSPAAQAATYYWDSTSPGTAAGFGSFNGIWGTSLFWSTSSLGTGTPANTAILATDDINFGTAANAYTGTVSLTSAKTAYSMTFGGTGAVTLIGDSATRAITLGSGGITMASGAGAVTLGNGTAANNATITLAAGAQTWTNNSTNNFTIANSAAASISRTTGTTLMFNPTSSGNFLMSTTHLPNDATGIVGNWGFFGSGANQRYAFNNSGTIAGYSGGTSVTDVNSLTSATVNYDASNFSTSGTLGAPRTANTIRYTGTGDTLDLGSSGANTLTFNGILAVGASGSLTIQRTGGTGTLAIGSSNELVIAGRQNVSVTAPISGSASITYAGTGTLTLSGSNTYTGTTTVGSGTLVVSGTSVLPTAGTVILGGAAGTTLQINNNVTIGNLSSTYSSADSSTGGTVALQSNKLTFGDASTTASYSGLFTGTSGAGIVKQGTGTQTLAVATLSSTISTTINAGTLTMAGGATGTTVIAGPVTLATNAILNYSGGAFAATTDTGVITSGNITLSGGAGTASIALSGTQTKFTINGTVTGQSGVNQTLAIVEGGYIANQGERQDLLFANTIADGGSGGKLSLQVNFTRASTAQQNAFVNLTGQNTFTGDLTVNNPFLLYEHGVSGNAAFNGAWVTIGGDRNKVSNTWTSGTGYLGSGADYSGNITLNTGNGTNGTGLTTLAFLTTANQILRGTISGAGALYMDGTGTLKLTNANTFSGTTTVNSSSLILANQNAVQNSTVTMRGGNGGPSNTTAAIVFDSSVGGNAFTFGGLAASSTGTGYNIALQNNAGSPAAVALTVGGNHANTTYAAALSATGSLIKTGLGNLTLNGTSTYSGVTTLNSGSLLLGGTGNLGATALTVNSGATFGVTQTANNTSNTGSTSTLTLNAGSAVNMADGFTSTLNVSGAATLAPASGTAPVLTINTAAANGTSDQLAITGAASIGAAGLVINLASLAVPSASSNTYTVLTAASGLDTGGAITLAGNTNVNIGGTIYKFTPTISPGSVVLGLTAGIATNPAQAYWFGASSTGGSGGTATSWNSTYSSDLSTNFSSDLAHTLNSYTVPGTATNVFIGATGASNLTTMTLDNAFSVNSVTFNSAAPMTLANGTGGSLTVGAGGLNIASTVAGSAVTINATINGSAAVTMNGTGTLTLGVTNGYTGGTILNSGTLSTTADANLGSGGGITVNGNATWSPNASGVTVSYARSLTINDGAILTVTGASNAAKTISGIVSGNGSIVWSTTTDLILSNANNTFNGPITVTVGNTNPYGFSVTSLGDSAGAGAISLNAGYFYWYGAAKTFDDRQFALSGTTSGGVIDNRGTGALTIAKNLLVTGVGNKSLTLGGTTTGFTNSFSGGITDGPGSVISLSKNGASTWNISGNMSQSGSVTTTAGTLILSGTNSFTGSTSITGGTLRLANTAALTNTSGIAVTTASSSLVFGTDAAFTTLPNISGGSGAFTYTFVSDRATLGAGLNHTLGNMNLGSATFAFTSGTNVNAGSAGITLPTVTMSSGTSGTAILSPTIATLTITGGVTSQNNDVTRTLQLDGTSTGNSIGGTITQSVASALSLTKSNTSTWTLSGTNSYNGATTLTGGTLSVSVTANLGAAASNLVFNGGNLQITGTSLTNFSGIGHTVSFTATKVVGLDIADATNTFTADQVLNQTTGGFTKLGAGCVILNQTNTYTGATTISAGVLQAIEGTGIATTSGISLDGGVFQSSGTFTRSVGAVSTAGSTTYNMTANGGGFSAIGSKFTVNLNNTATVRNWGSTVSTSPLVGTLKFGSTSSNAEVEMTNNINFNGATRTIDVTAGVGGDFATLSGILSNSTGSFGFSKTGTGTLVLTNANTYTGATTVSEGTLSLVGGSQSSAITVSSGASLGFTLGSASTSSASLDLTSGTVKITGTPDGTSDYTLMTASSITGTPVLDSPVSGYTLQKLAGNTQLVLVHGSGPGPVDHFAISSISSPQTVGMPITGITLTAKDSSNATATSFTGTVTFSGTGGFSGTSGTFSMGVLTGVNVTPTVIGSSRTLIVNDGASHTGTATFDVQSLYSAWATANGATGGTAGNPDGDGLSNLQEYAFGTNPTASTGEIMYSGGTLTATGAPKIVAAGGMYSMVFGRRADYVAAGLTYTVEFTAGLGVWVANDDGANPPVQIATDGTINAISVPYPDSITTPSGTQKPTFSRVKVELAP